MKKEHEIFSSYALIDLDALAHNLEVVCKSLGDISRLLAIVKADAYNHGAPVVADKLYRCGVRNFAVANIDEALLLRQKGIGGMMLVLGPMLPARYDDAVSMDVSVTVDSLMSLEYLDNYTRRSGNSVKVHLALNTGMNRIGIRADGRVSDELKSIADIIKQNEKIIPEGIFSHLCDADSAESSFTDMQYERFEKTVTAMADMGVTFAAKHICNSAGTLRYPSCHCDIVRFGIGLYGCEFKDMGFLPVMSFRTHVAQILDVKKGESIGYGLSFTAERDMRIATITAGYADGLNRHLSNCGCVIIKGRRAPIVGRVCMDMTMVDVTDISDAELFDKVTIIGNDGNETVTAEEVAQLCGTISYEILCCIGKRVNRMYIEDGKLLGI